MGHVPRIKVDPRDPESIVQQLDAIMHTLDGLVEFGNPQDPRGDGTSVLLAGAGGHNGTLFNIRGTFVELTITATGLATHTCTHNLGVQTLAAPAVNVRWLVFGWLHDGTGGNALTDLDLDLWYQGGTVTADAIELRTSTALAAGALTVNADHPIKLTLWFHPAVR